MAVRNVVLRWLRPARCAATAILLVWALAAAGAARAESPALAEVVLFGLQPPSELDAARYRQDGRHCVESYLTAVSREPRLRSWKAPAGPEQAGKARRRNLESQMAALLGETARQEAKAFASALPLSVEWEGMSEGPLDEAEFARQWLERYPDTPRRPFLHLFMAHRLRAGYEASVRERAKGLTPILAVRYREHLAAARGSANPLIACIAGDLETQPHVYLPGFGRP